jgi:hypothetical protein
MRQAKIITWTEPLKLFEREHLIEEGIRSKAELIENLEWQRKYTKPCKECELIREKLK